MNLNHVYSPREKGSLECRSDFENVALMIVDPETSSRVMGEKLMRKWIQQQEDPLSQLLLVLEKTENVYVVVVTVMYLNNLTLKLWTHTQEEQLLHEQLEHPVLVEGPGLSVSNVSSPMIDSKVDFHVKGSVSNKIAVLTEHLIQIALQRWSQDVMDSRICRNQVFSLITRFIKKGWCESISYGGGQFSCIVKSLLTTIISVLDSLAPEKGFQMSSQHLDMMRLLVEISHGIQRPNLAQLGMTWEDHLACKGAFEKDIMMTLMFHVFKSLSCCMSSQFGSFSSDSDLFQQSAQYSSFSSFLLILCDFIETFLEWDFSLTSRERLAFSDSSPLMPSEAWYSLLFYPQDRDGTTSIFQRILKFYWYVQNLLSSFPPSTTRLQDIFEKVQLCVKRVAEVRLTRLRKHLVGSTLSLDSFSPTNSSCHPGLTETVYSPLFLSIFDILVTSRFVCSSLSNPVSNPLSNELISIVALQEMRTVSYCLLQLFNNPEVDIRSLFNVPQDISPRIETLERCFLYVMVCLSRKDQSQVEELTRQCFYNFLLLYCTFCKRCMANQDDLLQRERNDKSSNRCNMPSVELANESFSFAPSLFTSAFHITQRLFSSTFQLFSLLEDDQDDDTKGDGDVWLSVDSPEQNISLQNIADEYRGLSCGRSLNDCLRQFAVLGQCQPREVSYLLRQALKTHLSSSTQVMTAFHCTSQKEHLDQELLYILRYLYYFLISQDLDNSSVDEKKSSMPRTFLLEGAQGTAAEVSVTVPTTDPSWGRSFLVHHITTTPEESSLWTTRPLESLFSVLRCFIGVYFFNRFQNVQGQQLFPEFSQKDFLQKAYEGILVCVIGVLQKVPRDVKLISSSLQCLLLCVEPYSLNALVFWEIPLFKQFLQDVLGHLLDPQAGIFPYPLKPSVISVIFKALASATHVPQNQELIQSFYGATKGDDKSTCERLGQTRLSFLLSQCQVFRDTVCSSVLQGRSQITTDSTMPVSNIIDSLPKDTIPIDQLNAAVMMCGGLGEGVDVSSPFLVLWMEGFLKMIQTVQEESGWCILDLNHSILKFLCAIKKHYIAHHTCVDSLQLFYSVVHLTAQKMIQLGQTLRVASFNDQDSDEDVGEDQEGPERGVTMNTQMLHQDDFVSAVSTLLVLLNTTLTETLQLNSSSVESKEKQWTCQSIVKTFNSLMPVLNRRFISQSAALKEAWCHLLASCFAYCADHVLHDLTPRLSCKYWHILNESLFFFSKPKCQEAAAEALEMCLNAFLLYQRQHDMVDWRVENPCSSQDLLADLDNVSDVLFIFHHHAAKMALRLLVETVTLERYKEHKLQFYGNLVCHLLTFLSTYLYNLKRVLDQLCQLSCYNPFRQENGIAESFLSKLTSPLLIFFGDYSKKAYDAVKANQSVSLQKIHYNKFRLEFQQHFKVFILAHRVEHSAGV